MGARITLSSCLIILVSANLFSTKKREKRKKERKEKKNVKETTNRQAYIRIILAFQSRGSNVFD